MAATHQDSVRLRTRSPKNYGRRAAWTSKPILNRLGVTASRVRFPSFPPTPRACLEGHESESRLAKGVRFQIALLGVQIPPDSPMLERLVSSKSGIVAEFGLLRFVANEENSSSAGSNPADSSKTSQAVSRGEDQRVGR